AGGADAAKFSITPAGVLTFNTAPNFEAPTDANGDNVYEVTVQASSGERRVGTQAVSVTVTNVNEAPSFTSPASFSAAENQTAVGTVTASDPDAGDTASFTIAGGADAAKFSITPAGVLTFNTAPNFEAPTDANGDNVYEVTVQA